MNKRSAIAKWSLFAINQKSVTINLDYFVVFILRLIIYKNLSLIKLIPLFTFRENHYERQSLSVFSEIQNFLYSLL